MEADFDSQDTPRAEPTPVAAGYWVISALLLLWGLGYAVLVAEALFLMRPSDFDRLVSAGMILPGYGDYVHHLPPWIVALTLFKGVTRVAGALGLLLRRRWAVSMYSLSLVVACVIFSRGFLLDDRASFEAPTQIGLDVVFFCLGVYAFYFAIAARLRGILR